MTMTFHAACISRPMAAAIAALVGVGGCADGGEEAVTPRTVVMMQGRLTIAAGTLTSANGTYGAGCTNRNGAWSVRITDGADVLTHPPLSVVKGNTGCVLTLTHLRGGAAGIDLYAATPSFAMTGAYQATSASFAVGSPTPIAFYGNAFLNALTFSSDFVIVILYSDNPNLRVGWNTANFTVHAASAAASGVAAPTYTIDMTPLVVSTDNANVVESAVGDPTLSAGVTAGQTYVVLTTLAGTSYAEVDAAFIAGSPKTAIAATIPAASFMLVSPGVDLTGSLVKRTIIIANTVSGVPSYQVITITFIPPVRA